MFCNILERLFAGAYLDVWVGDIAEVLLGDRAERSFFHYLRDERVAVHACAFDGDEEAVFFSLPAVDHDA